MNVRKTLHPPIIFFTTKSSNSRGNAPAIVALSGVIL